MAHYIITGGGGYIGKHITYVLAADRNNRITIIDIDTSKLSKFADMENVEVVQQDLTDKYGTLSVFDEIISDPVTVFHLAGIAEARNATINVQISKNTLTLKNTLDACISKMDKFIFASTSMLYYDPESAYARSKKLAENYLKEMASKYHKYAAIYRIFNVTGEHPSHEIWEDHEPETHLIPTLLQIMEDYTYAKNYYVTDKKIVLYANTKADGFIVYLSPIRSYIDVMDVVRAFIHGNECPGVTSENTPIWDIRTDTYHTIFEVWQLLQEITGNKEAILPINIMPFRNVKDVFSKHTYGGVNRLQHCVPNISLEESLINQIEGRKER